MDDPIKFHPTRAEQLDIMVSTIADLAQPGQRVLDLGCGKGYFIHLLQTKRQDLQVTGVDVSASAMDEARQRFGDDGFEWVVGDLTNPADLLSGQKYNFVTSGLVFHDLSDAQKQVLIKRIAGWLEDDGYLLLYDRIRLTESALFPLQAALWRRQHRIHGFSMRTTEDFAAYEAAIGHGNQPARLDDYQAWFTAAGLTHGILHLQGNIAILAAKRKAA